MKQQGYEITVLYDPTAFLMQQEREREERKTLTAAKKRELEQKRYEAEKAKMKDEILAELKAAGIIPNPGEKPEKPKIDQKPKGGKGK